MKKLQALPALLLLALSLCLLTGCGGRTEEKSEPSAESDLVYTAAYTPVRLDEEKSLNPIAFTGDGFYASSYEMLREGEIPEGATPSYEGEFDVWGSKLYYVNQSGEQTALAYESLGEAENPENYRIFNSGSTPIVVSLTPEGDLLVLEDQHRSWFDGPEDVREDSEEFWDYFHYGDAYWIRRLSAEGEEQSSAALDWEPDQEDSYLDVYDGVFDSEGRFYAPGDAAVFVFSPEGVRLARIELDGWVNRLTLLADGRVGAAGWGRTGGMDVAVLDVEKKTVSDRLPLNDYPERCCPGSGDYAFYYTNGVRLYGYRLEDQSAEELLNWLDCDVDPGEIYDLRVGEDGVIRVLTRDETGSSFVTLTQTPRSTLSEKQILTLGTFYPDQVSDAVIRFNRSHADVRIEIRDYSAYNQGDGLEGLTKLSTEIMAGNMPDLLALDSLPYEQLAAKGLLEDLYPWLDADPELDRTDFFENVLAAAEVKGQLCQVSSTFGLLSLLGASDVVGAEPGWTFDDVDAALATMPEGCTVLGPTTNRDEVLMMCLFTDMASYVNWDKAACDFDNEDFRKLLAFCAKFPAEPDYDGSDGGELARIASGQQMLMSASIYDLDEVCYNDQYFGGSCTYIGYPTRQGSGNVLLLTEGYGMSAACANKEAAWDFLRTFLTADYERGQYGLPLRRDVFQEQVKANGIQYETDEQGRYKLDENGERIPISRGGMGMSDGFGNMLEFEFYGLTQEQADKLTAVIDGADKAVDLNTKIYGIVREEAEAYFSGQKTAEETAKLIQSKVSLYLSEQS